MRHIPILRGMVKNKTQKTKMEIAKTESLEYTIQFIDFARQRKSIVIKCYKITGQPTS